MEPLTTIELGTCGWLGILMLACLATAETWHLASEATEPDTSFAGREIAQRAVAQQAHSR